MTCTYLPVASPSTRRGKERKKKFLFSIGFLAVENVSGLNRCMAIRVCVPEKRKIRLLPWGHCDQNADEFLENVIPKFQEEFLENLSKDPQRRTTERLLWTTNYVETPKKEKPGNRYCDQLYILITQSSFLARQVELVRMGWYQLASKEKPWNLYCELLCQPISFAKSGKERCPSKENQLE